MRFFTIVALILAVVESTDADCSHLNRCVSTGSGMLSCQNIIPRNLPEEINSVTIGCFQGRPRTIFISKRNFTGRGWGSILKLVVNNQSGGSGFQPELYLLNDTFVHLKNLKEIGIHMTGGGIEANVFVGLDNVETLDLTNCSTLREDDFEASFNDKVLNNLKKSIFVRTGNAEDGVALDGNFLGLFSRRPITYFDVSYIRISVFDFEAVAANCGRVETIIAKGVTVSSTKQAPFERLHACRNLTYIDVSEVKMPEFGICGLPSIVIEDIHNASINADSFQLWSNAETVIANNFCPTNVTIRNVTGMRINTSLSWNLKRFDFDRNNVEYMDIELLCDHPTIEQISARKNNLRYLNPKAFTCVHTLKRVDISDNLMYEMQTSNDGAFANLFMFLPRLQKVGLAGNGLYDLPLRMFVKNHQLVSIDLSRNKITQIYFLENVMAPLELLDISSNNIKFLDQISLNAIDRVDKLSNKSGTQRAWLDLRSNRLSCFACKNYQFITWVITHSTLLLYSDQLRCTDELGESLHVTSSVGNKLKNLCEADNRRRTIKIAVLTGVSSLVLVITACLAARGAIKKCKKNRQIKDIIKCIQEGQDEFEFLVFLAYSQLDETFTNDHVIPNLQLALQERTMADRDLVCTGDKEFRLGRPIHDEIAHCLRRCSVVTVVISDTFLVSPFCMTEFGLAVQMGKPILLMLKEQVNEGLMSAAMKEMFRGQTRLLWKRVDDRYVLTTSWTNVAQSIVDLLADR